MNRHRMSFDKDYAIDRKADEDEKELYLQEKEIHDAFTIAIPVLFSRSDQRVQTLANKPITQNTLPKAS